MSPEIALSALRAAVGRWYVGRGSAADIVRRACDLLVAGVGGPSLCLLAGASIRRADEEVPELLEAALREVGLAHPLPGSTAADEAGIGVMASRVLSGALTPRALAEWVLLAFGCHTIDLAIPLKQLGYAYEFYRTTQPTNWTRRSCERRRGSSSPAPRCASQVSAGSNEIGARDPHRRRRSPHPAQPHEGHDSDKPTPSRHKATTKTTPTAPSPSTA